MWSNMSNKKPKLGSGQRFKAVEKSAEKGGAKDPAAVAAAIGIKKYGKEKMAQMASAGKKRKKKWGYYENRLFRQA